MNRDDVRRDMETRARERARDVDASLDDVSASRRAPLPGDLYALPETAEHGIEWLLLDRADVPSRVLLVPADTNPLAGSSDVEIPPNHPLGPLTLRCGFGVWLDPDELDPADRTGVLDAAALELALKKRWALARESLRGSPLEREVDVDPEYQDWIDEILVPARTALEDAHREIVEVRTEETSYAPLRLAWGLAAMLLFAVVGLSLWSLSLQEAAELGKQPRILPVLQEIELGSGDRKPIRLEPVESGAALLLFVILDESTERFSTLRLEIVSEETGDAWEDTHAAGVSHVRILLPADFLGPQGKGELRVYGLQEGEEDERLDTIPLVMPGTAS